MNDTTEQRLAALFSTDPDERNPAFAWAIETTDEVVDWTYQVWDRALDGLSDKDNHIRAVSAQLLCNLAKSDPEKRIVRDFDQLLQVTRDPKFVTARHCLQNIWKVGLAGPEQLTVLQDGLHPRYTESFTEKNGTLIRFDILVDLADLHARLQDDAIKNLALAWTDEEIDPKYRKKYLGIWKSRPAQR